MTGLPVAPPLWIPAPYRSTGQALAGMTYPRWDDAVACASGFLGN